MSDTFELYRLSLLPRFQKDLLANASDACINREDYLRQVFGVKHEFKHFGNDFHYVPSASEISSEALVGRIGRTTLTYENSSPDKGLEDIIHEAWKAAVVVIDPIHHADGQKVAIECAQKVGEPKGLISSLVKAINDSQPHSIYLIEVSAIFDSKSFWDFARNNEGKITSLTFEFITPNMFGGIDDISEELKEFRACEKAQKVNLSISSQDGLNLDTTRVKESVEYTEKGAGNIKARAGNKTYNSTSKPKKVRIINDSNEPLLIRAVRNFMEILGRE